MSSTVHVEESVQIDRPVPEVWDAIADYSFDREWRKGLTVMTPDPPGGPEVGTKVHEVVHNSGREYVADTVVTSLDPGASAAGVPAFFGVASASVKVTVFSAPVAGSLNVKEARTFPCSSSARAKSHDPTHLVARDRHS